MRPVLHVTALALVTSLVTSLATIPATAAPTAPTAPTMPTSTSTITTSTTPTTSTTSTLDRYYNQRLRWGSCARDADDATGRELDGTGLQCATATVPLNYSDPRGRTITIAMSRLKATDTRHRIGSLLINTGGPGGPGVGAPPAIRKAMKDVGARYDIIGFDPRFVGRSTPLDCGWPVGMPWLSAGATRASFDRQVTLHKSLADKCRAADASVLPYVTTRNTARDMDVMRRALGERRISYLGYSYGTYLGTVYTQMFPGRTDRVVLDGAFAPDDYRARLLKGTERENEEALADWAGWAAERHGVYGLGRSRAEVLATVEHVRAVSARAPLTIGTGADAFRIDDTQVPLLLYTGTADDTAAARASFADQLSLLAAAADGRPPRPLSPEFEAGLRYALRGEGGGATGMQTAIICGDVSDSHDPESYWRDVRRSRATHPLFGPLANNITPCAFWDRPREAPTRVSHDAKALIVAATGDPRTTYRSSLELHRLLPSSGLLTVEGANRHGLYGRYGSACVDDRVNTYLSTGTPPPDTPTCPTP
ncbi:Tripeptidyl aminopeptidase [Streptomyces hundungensis]|uniref:Tripeptidyl aminopeptidase n=2 Tax=Streptomyces hundungensis TaxID=1077946 RepID=A0A387HKT8_9ACTN|nr:Tripeptidyl aminopeptidase [Streptomyces hundungensis]